MREKGGGIIINIASAAEITGFSNLVAYGASKGGVVLLTKNMALNLVKYNIRVSCICPGHVAIPMFMLKRAMEAQQNPEQTGREPAKSHPMGRLCQPGEIAEVALFLASRRASFITGLDLPVNRGMTI